MRPKRKLVSVLLFSAAPLVGSACMESAPSAPPPDNQVQPPSLLQLRTELGDTLRTDALANMPRFRPLCDADGYPLVGNIANKVQGYQPSEFCGEVRKRL